MGRLLLCLLILLSVAGTAPEQTKSEWCRLWQEGAKWPGYFFLCPKMNSSQADGLCCGTCTDSYCCSSEEDRLNQTLCPERDLTVRGKNRREMSHKMYVHIILIAVTAGSIFICFAWVTYVLCDVMKRRNSGTHSCDVELHQVILPSDSEVTDDTAIPPAVVEDPQEICDLPPASCEQPALDSSNPDCSTGEDRELPLSPANPHALPQDALEETMEAETSV